MTLPDYCFIALSPEREKVFRQYAHDHFDPNTEPSGLWHPVVRDEWAKLQQKWEEEHGSSIKGNN
jgi:hypothetical protein